MMRIAGGQFKGIPLTAPASIRPTETKVRQALFNILGAAIEGARVLEGFAGSGALGCEALSRGAAFVAFIEPDPEAIVAIQDNLDRCGPGLSRSSWRLLHLDIERGLRQVATLEPPFDVILLDPPYRTEAGKKPCVSSSSVLCSLPLALWRLSMTSGPTCRLPSVP